MPEPSSVRGPATIRCAPTSTSATSALVVSMNDVDSVVSTSTEEPVRPSTVKEPAPTALTVPWTQSRDRPWLAAAREVHSPEPPPASPHPPGGAADAEARAGTPAGGIGQARGGE